MTSNTSNTNPVCALRHNSSKQQQVVEAPCNWPVVQASLLICDDAYLGLLYQKSFDDDKTDHTKSNVLYHYHDSY